MIDYQDLIGATAGTKVFEGSMKLEGFLVKILLPLMWVRSLPHPLLSDSASPSL